MELPKKLSEPCSNSNVIKSSSSGEKAVENIEQVALNILKRISQRQFPFLSMVKHGVQPATRPTVSLVNFERKGSRKNFSVLVHLMSRSYSLILNHQSATKRDIFYENVSLFGNQHRFNYALHNLTCILEIPREALNIHASTKSLMAGSLRCVSPDGNVLDLSQFGNGMLIPSNILDHSDFRTSARVVLVIEKDAVFQRLLDDKLFLTLGPMILVTGKGYLDVITKRLLSMFSRTMNLKVLALVDCDPHGIEIAANIKWGSMSQPAYLLQALTVPDLVWVGLRPTDMVELALPQTAVARITPQDDKKIDGMQIRFAHFGTAADEWLRELHILRQMRVKAELEALTHAPRFLTDVYLRNKIMMSLRQDQQ